MNTHNQNRVLGFGLMVILIGLAILMHQLRFLPPQIDDIVVSWQMLLIIIGLYNLIFTSGRVIGLILIAIGGFFILPELFDLPYNFRRNFWPILLIVVGLFVIFRGSKSWTGFTAQRESIAGEHEYIDEFNIFSGSEKKVSLKNFKGGKITSIFGGSELDLTHCELSPETNVLEIFFLFGGSEIIIPADWNITNKVTSILGGFSDKGAIVMSTGSGPKKSLIIKGMVMFGGGEIKRR